MKKTEISPTYVIVWIVILIAAYGIGFCVHEIKLSKTKAAENKILSQDIKNIKVYVVNEEVPGDVMAQTARRARPLNTNTTGRTGAFSTGRGGQMGRGGMQQNFSQQDMATMQEQQRQMLEMMQNMANNPNAQMYGGFGETGDPAAMMNGYDPAVMMGGFDPGAMVAPEAAGNPGVLNPPEPQVEN